MRGDQSPPPPSAFETIHSIDMKFGIHNKLHLYFQLSETTWCLIGFHGKNCQINDVTRGHHFGLLSFQILFKFSLLYLKLIRKLNDGKSAHARCKNSGNNQTCPFSIIACFVFALSHKNRFSWFFIFSCAALSIKATIFRSIVLG